MCEAKEKTPEGEVTSSDLFRENWEHVRHVENERLGFTSVYIVVVAGVLAFLSQKGLDNRFSIYLVWLLVVLSFIGALISIRLRADMKAHEAKLKSLAEKSSLADYFTFGAETGWTRFIKLRTLFPLMYLICTLFFLWFALTLPSVPSAPLSQPTPSGQTKSVKYKEETPEKGESQRDKDPVQDEQASPANQSLKSGRPSLTLGPLSSVVR